MDRPLCLEKLREVRVPVDGHTVRTSGNDGVKRRCKPGLVLARQAVDEIDANRAHAMPAARLDDRKRLLDRLNAINRLLHLRVEVLHAQARAIEADRRELGNVARR